MWLKDRLKEGSTWKGILFAIAALAVHFVLGLDWYSSLAAGAAAYASGSVILPDKIGKPA